MDLAFACFGEVLWDLFPDYSRVGGAPLNVAFRLHSYGAQVGMISRIGKDELGENLGAHFEKIGLSQSFLQSDDRLATGKVLVALDAEGTASYSIEQPSAWDQIDLKDASLQRLKSIGTLIFGSLACRGLQNRKTLKHLLEISKFNVFDVNLRPPHYTLEWIEDTLPLADLVKVNEEELEELQGQKTFEAFRDQLKKDAILCLTKGGDGAELWIGDERFTNPGYRVKVADTVGAGDSFLATLIYELSKKTNPQSALDRACAVGSLVASKQGAVAAISEKELQYLMRQNGN